MSSTNIEHTQQQMDIVGAISTATQNCYSLNVDAETKNSDHYICLESLYSEINDIQQERTIEIGHNLTNHEVATENEYITCINLDSQTENHKILRCKQIRTSATVGMIVLALVCLCYGVYHFHYVIGDYSARKYNDTQKHVETELESHRNLSFKYMESFENYTTGLEIDNDISQEQNEYVRSVKSIEKAITQLPVTSQGNCNKPNHGSLKVDFHNLFKKECTVKRIKLKFPVNIKDRFTLSSIQNSIWVVSGFNLSIYSQDLELKHQCRMRVYMREIKQAYNGDLIIISSKYLYKMDRICENLETIDKRSDYQNNYYDALVVHACSFYVLFYKKRSRDGNDYINKKERYYKIRKFAYTTNNNTWNCVEEIKFTFRSLDPRQRKISSLLIYEDHFYVATTRKDESSVVKYSMTGNLVENLITKYKSKYGHPIYAVDTTGKFLTTEYYIENSYRKDRLLLVTDSLLTQLKILHLKLDMEIEDVEIDDENNLWILGHRGESNSFLNNMWKFVETDERDYFYTLLRCHIL